MPDIVATDQVLRIAPDKPPDYQSNNPLSKLLALVETQHLAVDRHFYLTDELQSLFPFDYLELAGPEGADAENS